MNHKKVYRLYKVANLALSRKKSKKLKKQLRVPMAIANCFNEQWSMDFISGRLTDNRRLRCLNIVDRYSRFNLAIEVATSLPAIQVIAILNKAIIKHGKPKILVTDNGPEFRSKLFQAWALKEGIILHYIDPGKPIQNAYIESFNGRFRDECLDRVVTRCLPIKQYT
jgi:putative transposase